ncbi:MAG: helix-turn-helix domain-containing protein [Polyangiales bacterium]
MTDMRMELMMKPREGVRVTDLAREYEVSRKTIYKFKERFEKERVRGLENRIDVRRQWRWEGGSRNPPRRTACGRLTSKASSEPVTGSTAIH